ncbi:MAG: hypothetical protein V7774_19135 [Pseudorhizobium pelagicum]|uniref:hypothetical protein n=1 Tax=Pseudorhizobium pelagicum TaxID=1509405 RepID=UPI0034615CBF
MQRRAVAEACHSSQLVEAYATGIFLFDVTPHSVGLPWRQSATRRDRSILVDAAGTARESGCPPHKFHGTFMVALDEGHRMGEQSCNLLV